MHLRRNELGGTRHAGIEPIQARKLLRNYPVSEAESKRLGAMNLDAHKPADVDLCPHTSNLKILNNLTRRK
jgi:hypothetical protein